MKKIMSVNLILVIAIILAIIMGSFLLNYIFNHEKTEINYFKYQKSYLSETNDSNGNTILSAEIKTYNLSAFEFVSAVSKDDKIENGEYLTNTGEKDAEYIRAPKIKKIESGQIIYQKHSKQALEVNCGDYVLYTTRIYNEGNTNAYASKITKALPIGLEFIATNEEYNGIWNLDGFDQDGRQNITTTWIAKGQGEEINSTEKDINYNNNLIEGIKEETIDYIDVHVLCKVVDDELNRVLVNYAQLVENTDEDGTIIISEESTMEADNKDIERIQIK